METNHLQEVRVVQLIALGNQRLMDNIIMSLENDPSLGQSSTGSKIKKKTVDLEFSDDGGEGTADDQSLFSPSDQRKIESTVRSNLNQYLLSKGIDTKYGDDFKIKIKKTHSNQLGYTAAYVDTDGRSFGTKAEVLAIVLENRKNRSKMASSATKTSRRELYDNAQLKLAGKTMPISFGKLNLINLGTINTSVVFHNAVQIYPVGYKCQQFVSYSTSLKMVDNQHISCEIDILDGLPQFKITVLSSGDTFLATSELAVWKKVRDLLFSAFAVLPAVIFFSTACNSI
jgi:hypothetical protein